MITRARALTMTMGASNAPHVPAQLVEPTSLHLSLPARSAREQAKLRIAKQLRLGKEPVSLLLARVYPF